ncbi:MAG: hypothetical protein Q7R94_02445 [bacterium]|nr:hypothetical protein [bacterium]
MRCLLFAVALLSLLPSALQSVGPYRDPGPPPPLTIKAVLMKVTAYDVDPACVGHWAKYKRTSTGKNARILDGVAADPSLLPYGKKLLVFGIPGELVVDDTGGDMRQCGKILMYCIDVRVGSHEEALRLFHGRGWDIVPVSITNNPKER